jgi:hypothetical protein
MFFCQEIKKVILPDEVNGQVVEEGSVEQHEGEQNN